MSDEKEWKETLDLIQSGEEVITSDLEIGSFVTLPEELFKKMVDEINESRIKNGNLTEGVDLIVVEEKDEESN